MLSKTFGCTRMIYNYYKDKIIIEYFVEIRKTVVNFFK